MPNYARDFLAAWSNITVSPSIEIRWLAYNGVPVAFSQREEEDVD